jgi:hypothetical protein
MVRNIIGRTVKDINPTTNFLLHKAQRFARTTWLQARWQRFDEVEYQKAGGYANTNKAKKHLAELYRNEARFLGMAALAALDAGDYLESARLNHLRFRYIPDEVAYGPEFQREVKRLRHIFRWIREAGLEVDDRFPKPEWYESPRVAYEGMVDTSQPDDEGLSLGGCQLRMEHEQRTNHLWVSIMAAFPRRRAELPRDHFVRVIRCLADGSGSGGVDIRRAAFKLCLRYYFVRSAARLLATTNHKKEDLLDFAHAIKRCMQNIPIGMSVAKVQEWQEALQLTWSALDESETLTPEERLCLHEMLMGRLLSIKESMSEGAAQMLTEKYHGIVDAVDLRAFYDDDPTIHRKGPGTINAANLAKFTTHFADSGLGCPVYISAHVLSSEYSFVVVGSEGHIQYEQILFGDLVTEARKLRETYKTWFRIPSMGDYQQVPWNDGFVSFAQAILILAQKCDHKFQWIVLSLDPGLASLPWQHLFLHLGRRLLKRDIIITLTPNLGWAPLAYRETTDFTHPTIKLRLSEDDEMMRELKVSIDKHISAIRDYPVDVTVVLGHGEWGEDDSFPKVTVGKDTLSINDWIEIADSRLVVLHSCHSGRTQSHFLGDYGALPGLILGLGSRLLCAPVAEVPPGAAEVFNEHIFRLDEQKALGLRYLAAIKREPSISMYNLYGMAAEPIY